MIPRCLPFSKFSLLITRARVLVVLMLVLGAATPPPASASFEELPTGARAAGMGDAFTAVADDVYATYYNPAGLVQLQRSEFSAYYARLYSGLSDGSNISRSFIAYGHPTATHGTFGFSYLSLSLAGLYSESTIGLSYAHALFDRWNLGGTLKLLKKSYGSDQYTANAINSDTGASLGAPDPLFAQNGNSKSAVGFDMGAQYRISRIYGVGLAILNANSPNVALSNSDTDRVSAIYRVGLARRTKMSTVDAEISMQKFTTEEYKLSIGAERWFQSGFGVRGGLGLGERQYENTTLGFSYRWEALEFGYALIYPLAGLQGTFGTNQVSVTFRFGRKN